MSRKDWQDEIAPFLASQSNPHTRRAYSTDLRAFLDWTQVELTAGTHAFSDEAPREFVAHLKEQSLSDRSARRRYAAVRTFGDWLAARSDISINPFRSHAFGDFWVRATARNSISSLSKSEYRKLLGLARECEDDRAYLIIRSITEVSLRRAEVTWMNAEDLDSRDYLKRIPIRATEAGPTRWAYVPDELFSELSAFAARHGISSGPLWRSMSHSSKGHRLTPHSIYRIVRSAAERAGMADVGAHTLRHTGCTLAIEAGASLQQVQAHARHKKLETTMTYVHQRDRLRDSAADFIRVDTGKGPRKSQ